MTNFHPQVPQLPQLITYNGQLFFVPLPNQPFLGAGTNNVAGRQTMFQAPQLQLTHHQGQHQLQQQQQSQQQQQQHLPLAGQVHLQHQLHQLQLPPPGQSTEPEIDLSIDNDLYFATSTPRALTAGNQLVHGERQQQQQQQHQQQRQIQVRPTPPVSKTNDRVKTKVKSIKNANFIGHYIDSQLIIETPEPLRVKPKKKKKKLPTAVTPNQHSASVQADFAQSQPQQQQLHVAISNQYHDISQQPLSSNSPVGLSPDGRLADLATDREAPGANQTATVSELDCELDSDILRTREEMKSWSVADVVNFIESLEPISAYSAKFAEDEIDGTALLYMIDRNLNMQVLSTMFKYGPAMKIEATLSKYKMSPKKE